MPDNDAVLNDTGWNVVENDNDVFEDYEMTTSEYGTRNTYYASRSIPITNTARIFTIGYGFSFFKNQPREHMIVNFVLQHLGTITPVLDVSTYQNQHIIYGNTISLSKINMPITEIRFLSTRPVELDRRHFGTSWYGVGKCGIIWKQV